MGGSPRQQGSGAANGKPRPQALPSATESSGEEEENAVSGSGSSSSAESGSRSSSDADSAGPAGSEVVVQSGERVDLPPFKGKLEKPMMEMVAGSNVWYQAHILQSSDTKLRVLFPAPTEGKKNKREWVLRTSSRIWRGSMSSRDWKYLSQGAWAPRAKGRSRKARSRAAAGGGGAQKRGRGSAGAIGGGGGAAGTTASGTGGAASEIAGGGRGGDGGHHSEEPDVASPRKRPRRAKSAGGSPASSGSDGEDDGHMGAFQRLPGSGGGSGGGRAAPVAVPRGVPRQANAAEARQRAAGRPQDPLVGWFVHHFTLLDRAGLLGDNYTTCSAEAGFLPPCQPARQPGSAAPSGGSAQAASAKQAPSQQQRQQAGHGWRRSCAEGPGGAAC